ncbi:TIGR03862 family flavoprotein [Thioclava sp. GXIMD2076]|uniref:TIGR03862 family flavoprotein n=1 Tax=Thioclava sp. GXIMD2076 TaxID=3131931 RepID=UPI0030D1E7F0
MTALVIGAGPAGLMAAEQIARAGHKVILADAMPTPARKFLMAGKSGLNLTKDEPPEALAAQYPETWIHPYVTAFGSAQMQDFARDLGIDIFTGSSGRVFPTGMKASPFLRAWLSRLDALGVQRHTRWHWTGWDGRAFLFDTPEGPQPVDAKVCVLALGGASWPRLGSTGHWAGLLAIKGIDLAPFRPANMGFHVAWSPHMQPHFGKPLKSIAFLVGAQSLRAECILSARGFEGGGIYEISSKLRNGYPLALDLLPDTDIATLTDRLARPRGKESLSNHLRKATRLDPVKLALLNEWARPLPQDPEALAALLKHLPVPLGAPFPIEEAISTAGGISARALTSDLELRALPGIFAAGEMLDWEAPTGGYLLTACFATGFAAGRAAAERLSSSV